MQTDSDELEALRPIIPYSDPRFRLSTGVVRAQWTALEGEVLANLQLLQQGISLLVKVSEEQRWGPHRWAGTEARGYDVRRDMEAAALSTPHLSQMILRTNHPRFRGLLEAIWKKLGPNHPDVEDLVRTHLWLYSHERKAKELISIGQGEEGLSADDAAWVASVNRSAVREESWMFADDYRIYVERLNPNVLAVYGRQRDAGVSSCHCGPQHRPECAWYSGRGGTRRQRELRNAGRRRPEAIISRIIADLKIEELSSAVSVPDGEGGEMGLGEILPARPSPPSQLIDEETERILKLLLKDSQMRLLKLKVDQLPSKEIATRLGMTVTHVDKAWYEIRKKLERAREAGFAVVQHQ